jgi:hypothetical protein
VAAMSIATNRTQLIRAADLRDQGYTWNEIRAATGIAQQSSWWFRAWEREGIPHRPADAGTTLALQAELGLKAMRPS